MDRERRLLRVFFLRFDCLAHGGPSRVEAVDGGQAVEDAVATQDDEVVLVFIDGKLRYFGLSNDDTSLASKALVLGFDVSEGSRDAQATWQHSVRSIQHLPRLTGDLSELVGDRDGLVCLCLIDLSTMVLDPVELVFLIRSVILRQLVHA